jgi:hypothetical protein
MISSLPELAKKIVCLHCGYIETGIVETSRKGAEESGRKENSSSK